MSAVQQVDKHFVVAYRTGTPENFAWHVVGELYETQEGAQATKQRLEKAGYPALAYRKDQLDSIGLPETFEYRKNDRPWE